MADTRAGAGNVLLKIAKVTKNKESLRNSHNQEDAEGIK